MKDKQIVKLNKLCEHWASHNDSHLENFEKWRNIAKEKGLFNVVENMSKAIEMMRNCNSFLLAAKKELDNMI